MQRRVAFIAALWLAAPHSSAAQDRVTVFLSLPSDDSGLGDGLREELASEGWRVEVVTGTGPERLAERARAIGAAATVSILPRAAGISVRAGERSRHLEPTGDDAVTILNAVETLRAWLTPNPSGDTTDAEPQARAAPTGSVWLGPGLVFSPGGLDAHLAVVLGGELRFVQRAYVEAFAAIGVPGTYLSQPAIELSLFTATAGLGLGYSFLEDSEIIALRAGAGVGFTVAVVDGSRSSWGALPYARGALGVRLIPELAVRLDLLVGVVLPALELRLRAGRTATFGLPVIATTLAFELTL